MHITSCLQETAVEWTASHRQHFQLETTSASKQSNVLPSLTLQVIHLILHQRQNQQKSKNNKKKCHRSHGALLVGISSKYISSCGMKGPSHKAYFERPFERKK